MSLYIAGLAFEHGSGDYFSGDRLGILVGSILSALVAFALLHIGLPKSARSDKGPFGSLTEAHQTIKLSITKLRLSAADLSNVLRRSVEIAVESRCGAVV